MTQDIAAFYDDFSHGFLRDYIYGNTRVDKQRELFSAAIARTASQILVIGCGSGEAAYFIATRVARQAKLLALDISPESLRLAETLFRHPRVCYRLVDIVNEPVAGSWDVIVLPDSYEHIPCESRSLLHEKLRRLLAENGKLLLTVPTPASQAWLLAAGQKLQIVDEFVTLEDLLVLGKEVGGVLTYYRTISVWQSNDYAHAVIERGGDQVRLLTETERIAVKGWTLGSQLNERKKLWLQRLRLTEVKRHWCQYRLRKGQNKTQR